MQLFGFQSPANCFGTALCSRFSCLNLSSVENAVMGKTSTTSLVSETGHLITGEFKESHLVQNCVSTKSDDQKEYELLLKNWGVGNKQSLGVFAASRLLTKLLSETSV